ncbi:MAG TPA: BatA domain-containing protein [Vicinamibacterales bacterium]|nr:BatA domain-containing protein [Vicinamibacterales bacterium]
MSFLSPLFLLGALAAAIPVVLHFMHREPEPRLTFPAVRLLRHAPVEDARHRRLREWLLLALRVAALALLACAFARPFLLSRATTSNRVMIIALDTSMSMSAPGRFARAQDLARDALSRAGSGDLVGVVTFADTAQISLEPTADRALARAAIDTARPGFGGTHYRAAFGAASQAIDAAGGASASITVVTDLQANGWGSGDRASIPASANIQVADVGALSANLAVTALRVEGTRALATIRNESKTVRDAHARLLADGKASGESTIAIAPGSSAEVEIAGVRGDSVSVTVEDEGGVPGDDTRFALVRKNTQRVFLVTTNGDMALEAFYLQQALSAAPPENSYSMAGVSTANAATIGTSGGGAVFLLSTRGLERRGREALSAFVRGGGGMFVAVSPDVDADVVGQILGISMPAASAARLALQPRALVPVDARHPVFQVFGEQAASLALARFTTVFPAPQAGCSVVASFTTGEPALSDCAAGSGRALVFASDLDNRGNDLPLHPSFVPFVQASARYLTGTDARPSDVLIAAVPKGVAPVPGIATIPGADGDPVRRIAVNVDPAESESERLTPEQFEGAVAKLREGERPALRLEARQREDRQHVWQYALFAVIALLGVESVVAARTA